MAYFSTTLRSIIERSFGGKLLAFSHATGLPGPEAGRLVRAKTPVTAAKLDKICGSESVQPEDKRALCLAAVHDLVPDPYWSELFGPGSTAEARRREAPPFQFIGTAPISGRAAQVLEYLITQAEHDPDVVVALELLGKFMEIPNSKRTGAGDPES